LAAGGIDVVALFAPNRGTDSSFKKSATEEVDCFFGRTFVGEAFDFVVGDQVHLCEKTTGVLGEEGGLFRGIVDSSEKNIFEEDLFLFGSDKDVTGFEKSIEGKSFIDRHDLVADGIARSVKGECEAELEWVIGKFLDLGGKSAGGDSDVTSSHAKIGRRDEEIEGWQEIGKVGQGFPHAHENQIVGSASGNAGRFEDLADDFRGGEIATPTVDPAGAEATAVGTSDLAGDAEGQASATISFLSRGGGNEDRFDKRSVPQFPKEFAGGVFGSLDGNRLGGTEAKAGGERSTEGKGEVSHFVIGGNETLKDPGSDLFFSVGLVWG
jgi:hypothetical protein